MFLHHFVDPDPRVEIFEKEWATGKGGIDFEMANLGTSAHLHWGLKKISCRFFTVLLMAKK